MTKDKSKETAIVCKIVVLGGGQVGKTRLIGRYFEKSFTTCYPNMEEEDPYNQVVTVDGKKINLRVLDTSSIEELRPFRDRCIGEGDGFIVIYPVPDYYNFGEIREIVKAIRQKKMGSEFYITLVASKADLERKVEKCDEEQLCKELGLKCIETSSLTGSGVTDAFEDVIRALLAFRSVDPIKPRVDEKEWGCGCVMF